MAQAMIDNFKSFKNKSTQTGQKELFIQLENKKTAKVYYSPSYNSNVLALNFGTSKTFIITKKIWTILKENIYLIDDTLNDDD